MASSSGRGLARSLVPSVIYKKCFGDDPKKSSSTDRPSFFGDEHADDKKFFAQYEDENDTSLSSGNGILVFPTNPCIGMWEPGISWKDHEKRVAAQGIPNHIWIRSVSMKRRGLEGLFSVVGVNREAPLLLQCDHETVYVAAIWAKAFTQVPNFSSDSERNEGYEVQWKRDDYKRPT